MNKHIISIFYKLKKKAWNFIKFFFTRDKKSLGKKKNKTNLSKSPKLKNRKEYFHNYYLKNRTKILKAAKIHYYLKKQRKLLLDRPFNSSLIVWKENHQKNTSFENKLVKNVLDYLFCNEGRIAFSMSLNNTLVGGLREISKEFVYAIIPEDCRTNLSWLTITFKDGKKRDIKEAFALLRSLPYSLEQFYVATTESGKEGNNPHLNILCSSFDLDKCKWGNDYGIRQENIRTKKRFDIVVYYILKELRRPEHFLGSNDCFRRILFTKNIQEKYNRIIENYRSKFMKEYSDEYFRSEPNAEKIKLKKDKYYQKNKELLNLKTKLRRLNASLKKKWKESTIKKIELVKEIINEEERKKAL